MPHAPHVAGTGAVRVQTADFDVAAELAVLRAESVGAIVCFVGTVRDMNEESTVFQMELEHYPGMTEKVLHDIVAQAKARWDIVGVRIVHRVGVLVPADQIVLVAVSAAHRKDAFPACGFVVDSLKAQAPLWKKEERDSGVCWVSAKESDQLAAQHGHNEKEIA
ncbi:MAG: molybdenum cofactor biosynthesis protein MoaE [Burkholderiaceae bacterium]|jgi:molybdopterin synthase catalytic subunit|nr:molybdenum cofactor biosynthesis protein MoaE [Burkholderiaceae bacterium]